METTIDLSRWTGMEPEIREFLSKPQPRQMSFYFNTTDKLARVIKDEMDYQGLSESELADKAGVEGGVIESLITEGKTDVANTFKVLNTLGIKVLALPAGYVR